MAAVMNAPLYTIEILRLAGSLPDPVEALLTDVQHDLFDLGGELSIPGYNAVSEAHVERLESAVERFNADLKPLKEFILPAGTRAASYDDRFHPFRPGQNPAGFEFKQFNSNAVVRWEYRPGSALFLVWTQQRQGDLPIAGGGAGVNPLSSYQYKDVGVNIDMTPTVTLAARASCWASIHFISQMKASSWRLCRRNTPTRRSMP